MGSRGQPSVGSVRGLGRGLTKPPQLHPGSSLTWPALTPRRQRPHTLHINPGVYTGPERAEVHTSFIQVQVQILVFKNTLVKVEVLTKLLYSSKSKEALKCT